MLTFLDELTRHFPDWSDRLQLINGDVVHGGTDSFDKQSLILAVDWDVLVDRSFLLKPFILHNGLFHSENSNLITSCILGSLDHGFSPLEVLIMVSGSATSLTTGAASLAA